MNTEFQMTLPSVFSGLDAAIDVIQEKWTVDRSCGFFFGQTSSGDPIPIDDPKMKNFDCSPSMQYCILGVCAVALGGSVNSYSIDDLRPVLGRLIYERYGVDAGKIKIDDRFPQDDMLYVEPSSWNNAFHKEATLPTEEDHKMRLQALADLRDAIRSGRVQIEAAS